MATPSIVPIWRYHGGIEGRYRYSKDANLGGEWVRESIVWHALSSGTAGGVAFYEHRATAADGAVRYTYNASASVGAGWERGDVAWYAFRAPVPHAVPVYQYHQHLPEGGLRFAFFTTQGIEGWTADGVAFYCLPATLATRHFGIEIASPGNVTIAPNAAYDFSVGDFSITAMFRTRTLGTLISREAAGPRRRGWRVALLRDGGLEFVTADDHTSQTAVVVPTTALDGQWHHIAAVRRTSRLELWLDGRPLAAAPPDPAGTANVSSSLPIVIGSAGEQQQPFVATIEDVTIWDAAVGESEVMDSMFNLLEGDEPGLVGFWMMDRSLADSSRTGNAGVASGPVSFVPIFQATWVQKGRNAFSFVSIVNDGGHDASGAAAATRVQSLVVEPGASFLIAAISDPHKMAPPAGVQVVVQAPNGKAYTEPQDTEDVHAAIVDGSLWKLVVRSPEPGTWTATIAAPPAAPFVFCFHTLPNGAIVDTMTSELAPLYGLDAHAAARRRRHGVERQEGRGLLAASLVIGAIGLAGIAILAAAIPGAQVFTIGFGAAAVAAVYRALGIASEESAEHARAAKLRPHQAAREVARAAGFSTGDVGPSVVQVWARIRQKVGDPATTDPSRFASRTDMGIDAQYRLHVDVGGEGHFTAHGIRSGFDDAINLNDKENDTQRYLPIPLLIRVGTWHNHPTYPFADGTIDNITMQGAPLTEKNVSEIARVLAPGGKVGLWIGLNDKAESSKPETNFDRAKQLAALLDAPLQFSCQGPDVLPAGWLCNDDCVNESPDYPMRKVCITRRRNAAG